MNEREYQDIAGSGTIRVATSRDLERAVERNALLERVDAEPLEGTLMSLWNSQIPAWWSENITGTSMYGTPDLATRVWVANRCQQLVSQTIASARVEHHGGGDEPAWVSSPDPNVFPNGIGDAIYALVDQLYGWGFSCQYVTDRYADGYPRRWTVLPSSEMNIRWFDGSREYRIRDTILDPSRVIQIDRNPTTAAHGTSALRAYAQTAWGLLAAGNQSMTASQGGIPQAVLKSKRKLTQTQAQDIQTAWMAATTRRNGAPPVLGIDMDFEALSFNPRDLALLETQEWNSRILATAYGVPAVLLNMSLQGGLTYQNPLALMQMWWLTELRTKAKQIADAFTAQMLPAGQWVSFDASDMLAEPSAQSADDDPQLAQPGMAASQISQVAKASPAQQLNGSGVGRMVHFEEGAIHVEAPAPSVIVRPANVHVDVHNGQSTRTVTFSNGETATIEEGVPANVD